MACKAEELRQIPLFTLLDEEEIGVLAAQVEIKKFGRKIDREAKCEQMIRPTKPDTVAAFEPAAKHEHETV